jgi:hypothetical protein
MEVPAKRTRLAPRDLKLLDLDDDALIMIIDKLDQESKLQMMATCKRFDRLIGSTHQFYKNFKFSHDERESKTKETRYLEMVRRKFGIVEICSGVFHFDKELKPEILEFLKTIGAHILKMKLCYFKLNKSDFLESLRVMSKIEELEFNEVSFIGTGVPDGSNVDFKSEHLTKLKICEFIDFQMFSAFVPSSLKILKLKSYKYIVWDSDLLGKQTRLEELSLERFTIKDFKFDPENCRIEKLEIQGLRFLDKSAFEKFSDFVKIQESVKELELHLGGEELKTGDHTGILTHLLSLKTLRKVTIGCEYSNEIFTVLSKIQVSNPAVDTLTIKNVPAGADLQPISKFFPNATHLKITWEKTFGIYHHDRDFFQTLFVYLQPINSMRQIRKFEIDYMKDTMFSQLDLKQLQEFHVTDWPQDWWRLWTSRFDEARMVDWLTFIQNNPQLEVLDLPNWDSSIEHLQIVLENLSLLKRLNFKIMGYCFVVIGGRPDGTQHLLDLTERTAQLIGENYDRFEDLQLKFIKGCGWRVTECLQKYPGVKIETSGGTMYIKKMRSVVDSTGPVQIREL